MPDPLRLAEITTHADGELVFGVVAPTGINLDAFEQAFTDLLNQFNFTTNVIRLSGLVSRLHAGKLGVEPDQSTAFTRVNTLMTLGNKVRAAAKRGDVLALHAISEISSARVKKAPRRKTAHLLRSLKHPEEVEALRRVYGPGFFLIGIYQPEDKRFKYLTNTKGMSEAEANALLQRDLDEAGDPFGQHTRDTFALADVFVTLDDDNADLHRFVDLIFGHPFKTPTQAEHAMFLAYAASLRSAQLARQIGAVVVSQTGEVIGTGANDVPCFGGGQYWPGDDDCRDHTHAEDPNDREIARIADDAISRLTPFLKDGSSDEARAVLQSSRIGDLTEFGRVVHAEMEALLACARSGVSVKGATLYSTTFPCHNCAKHIVAAGVERVVFIEPYPKSKAPDLHEDSIAIDDADAVGKVRFEPFVGVAARRYFDLFSMKLSSGLPLRRKISGKTAAWQRQGAVLRIRMSPWSYIDREHLAIEQIDSAVEAIEIDDPLIPLDPEVS